MFKSRVRPINIPQYEHGRLAGVIASLWGNDDFDQPAVGFTAFVQGVALHDWHYGLVDNLAIGEASEAQWLEMVRKGADYCFADPVTDIVAKLHLKRLLGGRDSAVVTELVGQVEARIEERLQKSGFSREPFEWADRITRFSDEVAFDFSFEKPVERTLPLYARVNSQVETPVTYAIGGKGAIGVEPWPFSQPSFLGIITGYERSGYPQRLQPLTIHYHCQPKKR